MKNEDIFAARINRIGKNAKQVERIRKVKKSSNSGGLIVMPLMLGLFMAGGTVFAWDMMDRPTDNPFEVASTLTAMFLASL